MTEILSLFNVHNYDTHSLEEIQERSRITCDIYGLGHALMEVFAKSYYLLKNPDGSMNEPFIKEMYKVLFSMIHPNCFERITFETLKDKYMAALSYIPSSPPTKVTKRRQTKRKVKSATP
jgi:hypothetical protein